MALNRRSMLLGLVVLVVAAGVIGASGAFSSVQAERTMDIETKGDRNALLGLVPDGDSIAQTTSGGTGDTGNVETLAIANESLNENAITRFGSAFYIVNNGEDPVEVYIEANSSFGLEAGGSGPVNIYAEECTNVNSCTQGQSLIADASSPSAGNTVRLPVGGNVTVGVQVDTTGDTTQADLPANGTVTIWADNPNENPATPTGS